MKLVKRFLCLLLALAVLAALSACGSFTPRMLIASQKMTKLQSLHSDTTLKVDAALDLFGEERPLSLELRVAGDHQKEPGCAAYDAQITVSSFTKRALLYTAKDEAGRQRGCYTTDEGATWVYVEAQEAAQGASVEKSDLAALAIGLADHFEESGTAQLPTGEAIVYTGAIPAQFLQELLLGVGAVEKLDEQMPFVVDDSVLALIGDVPTTLALNRDSSMLVRVELDLTQVLGDLSVVLLERYLAEYGIEELVELRVESVTLVTELSEFDNVSVELPEALKTAN